jgi:hypothetical protein
MKEADDPFFSDDDVWSSREPAIDSTPQTSPQESSQASSQESPKATQGPTKMSVDQWLESLRRSDRAFYNMMAMEVWSIAKSMDTLLPGFWSKFMENRQAAMKNFIHDRRTPEAGLRLEDLDHPDHGKSDPSRN